MRLVLLDISFCMITIGTFGFVFATVVGWLSDWAERGDD